jgi:hypothetical protein
MKAMLVALILVGGAVLESQAVTPSPLADTLEARKVKPPASGVWVAKKHQPNEIAGKRFSISGISVQLIKTRNPLPLINPFAPADYGSGRDNFVAERDPMTGRRMGLKVFSFEF